MTEKRYRVTGMGCDACVTRVKKAVSSIEGVERAEVDLALEQLTVEYDEKLVRFEILKDAVEDAGYGLESF